MSNGTDNFPKMPPYDGRKREEAIVPPDVSTAGVANTKVRMMTIDGLPARPGMGMFDTIRVFIDPDGPGRCRVTITHARDAWTAGWSAIGSKGIENFFAMNSASYLMDSFLEGIGRRADYYEKKRLMQIIMAVQHIFHRELSA